MPRRIPDYPDAYAGWNAVASFGSLVTTVGAILFIYIIYKTLTSGEKCPANPWNWNTNTVEESATLEWVLPSPPPFHTFEETPLVKETK